MQLLSIVFSTLKRLDRMVDTMIDMKAYLPSRSLRVPITLKVLTDSLRAVALLSAWAILVQALRSKGSNAAALLAFLPLLLVGVLVVLQSAVIALSFVMQCIAHVAGPRYVAKLKRRVRENSRTAKFLLYFLAIGTCWSWLAAVFYVARAWFTPQ